MLWVVAYSRKKETFMPGYGKVWVWYWGRGSKEHILREDCLNQEIAGVPNCTLEMMTVISHFSFPKFSCINTFYDYNFIWGCTV